MRLLAWPFWRIVIALVFIGILLFAATSLELGEVGTAVFVFAVLFLLIVALGALVHRGSD